MNRSVTILLAFMLLMAAGVVSAQQRATIMQIDSDDGMTNSAVNAVFQDSEGVMWFGTWDGLNRYDGGMVTQFNHRSGQPRSLSHQVIRSVCEEDARHLWVTTDYGINRFDKHTGEAQAFFLGHENETQSREDMFVCRAMPGAVVAAAYRGGPLHIYSGGAFVRALEESSNASLSVSDLFLDERGTLFVVRPDGVLVELETLPGGMFRQRRQKALPLERTGRAIQSGGSLWFVAGGTLRRLLLHTATWNIIDTRVAVEGSLNALADDGGTIIFGTPTGCYEMRDGEVQPLPDIEASVLALVKGTQDILWIGTDGRGCLARFRRPDFLTTISSPTYDQTANHPVRAILQAADGTLWIGSKGGGLVSIHHYGARALERVATYDVGAGRSYNSVFALASAADGTLWIGTDGKGLLRMTQGDDRPRPLDLGSAPLASGLESVYCICQTDAQTLYAGTSGGGLFRLTIDGARVVDAVAYTANPQSPSSSIGSDRIYALADDGDRLWIATRSGGLSRLDKQSGEVRTLRAADQPDGICCDDVISLLRDSGGRLWVGTTSGLSLCHNPADETPSFRTIDRGSGLPNDNIHAIREDSYHNIWVSTSHGIARIDSTATHVISFLKEDGLQGNEFCDGAGFASADGGTLFFGGTEGVNIVYPGRIDTHTFMPRLVLRALTVSGTARAVEGDRIEIPSNSSYLTLDFSVTDYISNPKCQIAYKLETRGLLGYGKGEWVDLGSNRVLSLSGLQPGTYRLLVRASNGAQVWGEPTEWTVRIAPPPYATWWAWLIYVACIAAAVWKVVSVKRQRLLMRHELELERQEKENKESTHQAKLRFFTNIAHEFSNSITLIYGAVEQILAKNNPSETMRHQLLAIQRNTERMRRQISELMEFRKAETGYLHPQYEVVDVGDLIQSTCDNFTDNAEQHGKRLTLTMETPGATWVLDRGMTEKIVFNIVSNAMKYTPDGGFIELRCAVSEERGLVFDCTNNGPGIKAEEIGKVFNRFTVLDNFEKKLQEGIFSRTGIGLALCKDLARLMGGTIAVESEVGKTTTFTVTIPAHQLPESNPVETSVGQPLAPISPSAERHGRLWEKGAKCVLVVDDQPEICDLICEILGDDYRTVRAGNGLEALARVEECAPDLIVSDIIMPGMNGVELIKRLKADERTRHIPVVMLSSKSDIESRIEVTETGASMFLTKPFHPQYLRSAVEGILNEHSVMKEWAQKPVAYKERLNMGTISGDERRFLDHVLEILAQKFGDEDYDYEALASDLAISRSQLYRRIKAVTGASPGEFIRSYRLDQARQMLVRSDKTIGEVMVDCGFHNKAYFYRLFQKAYGCSPREYRNKN